MNNKIIIFPWAKRLPDGRNSAKDYQEWKEVVRLLKIGGYHITQIGTTRDEEIGADVFLINLPFVEVRSIIKESLTFISVDTYAPHLAQYYCLQPGIVIWGQSDPKIYGYDTNINLLKDPKFLRQEQFRWWADTNIIPESFVSPQTVYDAVEAFKRLT